MLCLAVYTLLSSGCYAPAACRVVDSLRPYVIVMRSIAVLPMNWATIAVRRIDHKSAFKMNFNIYYVNLKF